MREALQLRKLFEYVGDRIGIHLEVIITDGRQPVGNGIGPVLEARDVMAVLQNKPDAPSDLRQVALRLAGRIIEFDPDIRGGHGFAIARDILDSGRALTKMNQIIDAQGRRDKLLALGQLTFDITAPTDGVVTAIDNLQMARIARMAGAPMDKGAGVDLVKKLGDEVSRGDILYRVYAEFPSDFEFAMEACSKHSGYQIGQSEDIPSSFVDY
jgi:thymidine phosphorylase